MTKTSSTTDTLSEEKQAIRHGMAQLSRTLRIPGWQLAGILRQQGWEEDRLVTEAEFLAALQDFKTRRMGGGRK